MKFLHTSDWHLGRRWKSMYRYDELEAVLDNLVQVMRDEHVDFVLHSGDLFDTRNPPERAQDLAFRFFLQARDAGVQSVVIAGNHDHPGSFDAQNRLTKLAGVHLIGRPRPASKGGVITLQTQSGESAVVAALPFASPGQFVSGMDLAGDEAESRVKYARMFQAAAKQLAQEFRSDAVNIFMAHTHLEGAVLAQSERRVHVGEQWAGTNQDLPTNATYVALGHIHKPQRIDGMLQAYYAGSPLQLDFGEIGEEKTFNLVTATPGRPAQVEHRSYEGGKTLRHWEGTWEEFEVNAPSLQEAGWLRVQLHLDERDPEFLRRVRELVPNAVTVLPPIVPEEKVEDDSRPDVGASFEDFYHAYHQQHYGTTPSENVLKAFCELREGAFEGEEK